MPVLQTLEAGPTPPLGAGRPTHDVRRRPGLVVRLGVTAAAVLSGGLGQRRAKLLLGGPQASETAELLALTAAAFYEGATGMVVAPVRREPVRYEVVAWPPYGARRHADVAKTSPPLPVPALVRRRPRRACRTCPLQGLGCSYGTRDARLKPRPLSLLPVALVVRGPRQIGAAPLTATPAPYAF